MKDRSLHPHLQFLIGVALIAPSVYSGSVTDSLMSKIRSQGKSDAVLELPSVMSSVLSNPALAFLSGDAKTSMLTTLMKRFTSSSQAPFMSAISNLGFAESAEPFWMSNKVSITNANLPLVQALSSLPGPFTLREPHKVNLIRSVSSKFRNITKRQTSVEWGVRKIGAPAVWRAKTNGKNVIVAGIDTGVFREHESLIGNYANGWFDAMNGKRAPYDDDGHGTHTMGTIAGQKGIGVAPGAKWIACKALGPNKTGGTDAQLTRCAQFVLNFRPMPRVVCNSWGGGQGGDFFNQEIEGWQAAGIVPVFSIGNKGPGCMTAGSPGDQPNLISVGAMDSNDNIARFSSRGYAVGRDRRIKPEVSAPGVDIQSASHEGKKMYKVDSGTSMAAPHVAGAVALMLSANPDMEYSEIIDKLETTAFRSRTNAILQCGAANGNWPNNVFGFGRIDVKKAMGV